MRTHFRYIRSKSRLNMIPTSKREETWEIKSRPAPRGGKGERSCAKWLIFGRRGLDLVNTAEKKNTTKGPITTSDTRIRRWAGLGAAGWGNTKRARPATGSAERREEERIRYLEEDFQICAPNMSVLHAPQVMSYNMKERYYVAVT